MNYVHNTIMLYFYQLKKDRCVIMVLIWCVIMLYSFSQATNEKILIMFLYFNSILNLIEP